jgi:hypothetical protein
MSAGRTSLKPPQCRLLAPSATQGRAENNWCCIAGEVAGLDPELTVANGSYEMGFRDLIAPDRYLNIGLPRSLLAASAVYKP